MYKRQGDASAQASVSAAEAEVVAQGGTSENNSGGVHDKHAASTAVTKSQAGEEQGEGGGEGGPARSNSLAKKPRSVGAGRAPGSSQEQALQGQVR